jgi:Domain of unknown function (DUF4326)
MRPEVLNRHHFHGKPLPPNAIYVGRGTPLGNPFTLEEYGRGIALDMYHAALWRQIEAREGPMYQALLEIGPDKEGSPPAVVCSCAPAPCHGDIIAQAVEWIAWKGEW